MHRDWADSSIRPGWWTAILVATIVGAVLFTSGMFAGTFRSFVDVWLTTDRVGLVMEPGAKVKMRGIEVGRVSHTSSGQPARLKLEIFPDQIKYIPANVEGEIRATTAFGSKFVDLVYPSDPVPRRLSAGAVLRSRNVTTEVNTVFENLVNVLRQVEPSRLNAVLTAIAEAVRGKGQVLGEAITGSAQVLSVLNVRSDMIRQDFQSLKGFSDTYSAAADDIIKMLDASSTTSATVTSHAKALDALLLNVSGFARTGIDLLGANQENLVRSINLLAPTTSLLLKYNPEYTCLLLGAVWYGEHAAKTNGANGYSTVTDASIGLASDMYRYPENLPVVAAKGGPDGKPGCGSLPDASKNFPVRYLVTNTGWGTGLDMRPNPGISHPWWINYFPVTRAVPEPPSIRGMGPPAIGPVPYPGAPPYGAPLFAADGTPLWAPPPPGAPPPPVPGTAVAPPPYGPGPASPSTPPSP
ncbi:MCE family protein [Mycolicibacterium elephantis]|uniref:MCE family protein n=1 Tax=Mycolicibacterium elephantis TaxID=81858 RepID=UPI0006290F0C|nr:MCE family protein [Mycolicibacterium elephantis]KKW65819.1 MCE-family protein MCE3A [Mycolicibacterium elephantis]OBB16474.1 MCE-family protein MCE3A [Mycolicibacterium elephantis]OBE94926.1 MCE-family protein MCE3A [Mycolicibacterium elephantis]